MEAALKTHKSLEGIKVKSVEDGVVLLDGSTQPLEQKLRAIETAYACPGVWRVAAEIETKDR